MADPLYPCMVGEPYDTVRFYSHVQRIFRKIIQKTERIYLDYRVHFIGSVFDLRF